jgi:branched-subunit amino acid ABC-type transport system permease component
MDLNSLVIQLLAGLSDAMILFLLASGLTLIFGVMNILNFAHATMWLLGGYITYSVFEFLGGSAWLLVPAIIAGTAIMALFGLVLERVLISRMYERELPEQLLLTFALVLILGDLIKLVWGVEDRGIFLGIEPLEMFDTFVNPYYFVIIAVGVAVAAGLWLFLQRTRYGKIVRAAVYSRDMVSALGIRIPMIYAGVFALGVGIAAFAAGVFLPLMPMALGVDIALIVQCFAVVVIGGFGSVLGTFVASLIVGIVYSFSILIWPDGALAVVFLIVVAVLIWRPWGGPVRHRAAHLRGLGNGRQAGDRRAVCARARRAPRRRPARAPPAGRVLDPCRQRDPHPRPVRHELQPDLRLHGPDLVRPCRVLRPRRLCHRHPVPRAQRRDRRDRHRRVPLVAARRAAGGGARGGNRRLLLRSPDRHLFRDPYPRLR